MQFPWIKRSDLIVIPHDSGGWVVKDPLTLNYAHLNEPEYHVLNLLDGRLSFPRLLSSTQYRFPDRQLSADDIGAFISLLAGHQLIRRTSAGDSVRLNPETSQSLIGRIIKSLMSVLRLHLPLINPSRFLDWSLPVVSKLSGRTAVIVFTAAAMTALMIVLMRMDELRRQLPTVEEFLGATNLLLMLGVFVLVKVLHEAGHAFAARYFGAECNECGVMLMVFTPVLYTNVSDAWLLPKNQRLLVTAAGILVELFIASVATLLWWNAAPGLTKSLLLNTMLICSLNTVLFNGNPLLRFDGYFLLADWVGIPNLASRAGTLLQDTLLSFVSGQKPDGVEPPETRRFLLTYGLLSTTYRLLLTLAILQLVHQISRQWRVEFVGTLMSGVILLGFIVFPTMRFSSRLLSVEASEENGVSRKRLLIATGLALLVLLTPLPQSVIAPGLVQPTGTPIYATLPGSITPQTNYGDHVESGDIIARLANSELEQTAAKLEARVTELQLRIDTLQSSPLTASSDLLPTLQQSLEGAQEQFNEFQNEMAGLKITSPASGVFLSPVAIPKQKNSELPEQWEGLPVQSRNTGAWIDRGVLLGHIGNDRTTRLIVCVEESEIELLNREQAVDFLPLGGRNTLSGTVAEVSQMAAVRIPFPFGASGLTSGQTAETGFKPANVSYLVTVHLKGADAVPAPALYSMGHARIHIRSASLMNRVLRYLRRTFG